MNAGIDTRVCVSHLYASKSKPVMFVQGRKKEALPPRPKRPRACPPTHMKSNKTKHPPHRKKTAKVTTLFFLLALCVSRGPMTVHHTIAPTPHEVIASPTDGSRAGTPDPVASLLALFGPLWVHSHPYPNPPCSPQARGKGRAAGGWLCSVARLVATQQRPSFGPSSPHPLIPHHRSINPSPPPPPPPPPQAHATPTTAQGAAGPCSRKASTA